MLWPFPRLTALSMRCITGCVAANPRATSAVSSVDPSLTTIISAFQALALINARMGPSVRGRRLASLYAGIMMLHDGRRTTPWMRQPRLLLHSRIPRWLQTILGVDNYRSEISESALKRNRGSYASFWGMPFPAQADTLS